MYLIGTVIMFSCNCCVEISAPRGAPASKNKRERRIYFKTRLLCFAFVLFHLRELTTLSYLCLLIIFLSDVNKLKSSKIEVLISSNCIVRVNCKEGKKNVVKRGEDSRGNNRFLFLPFDAFLI